MAQLKKVWLHPTSLGTRETNLDEAGIKPNSSRAASDRSIHFT